SETECLSDALDGNRAHNRRVNRSGGGSDRREPRILITLHPAGSRGKLRPDDASVLSGQILADQEAIDGCSAHCLLLVQRDSRLRIFHLSDFDPRVPLLLTTRVSPAPDDLGARFLLLRRRYL